MQDLWTDLTPRVHFYGIELRLVGRIRYFISQLRMILRGAILQRNCIIWRNYADTNSWWNLQTLRLDHLDRAALA